jgi:hypothetical protein
MLSSSRRSRSRGVVRFDGPSSKLNRIILRLVPPESVSPAGNRRPVESRRLTIAIFRIMAGPGSSCSGSSIGAGAGRIAAKALGGVSLTISDACMNEPPATIARAQQTTRSLHEIQGMIQAIVRKRIRPKRESRNTCTGLQLQRAIASVTSVGQMGEA